MNARTLIIAAFALFTIGCAGNPLQVEIVGPWAPPADNDSDYEPADDDDDSDYEHNDDDDDSDYEHDYDDSDYEPNDDDDDSDHHYDNAEDCWDDYEGWAEWCEAAEEQLAEADAYFQEAVEYCDDVYSSIELCEAQYGEGAPQCDCYVNQIDECQYNWDDSTGQQADALAEVRHTCDNADEIEAICEEL